MMDWLLVNQQASSRLTLVGLLLIWSYFSIPTISGRFNSSTGQLISCRPNPCLNQGVCETDAKTQLKSCRCLESHVGQYCQHINPCYTGSDITKRCMHQGNCQVVFRGSSFVSTDTSPTFRCDCKLGYSASLCEIPVPNVCDPSPCSNGGRCTLNGTLTDFNCQCRHGYRGVTCGEVDFCATRPCNNSGKCISGRSGYTCQCASGFEGVTCSQDINECTRRDEPVVCHNGGTCVNTIGSYRCSCKPGYSGQNCESIYVPCNPNHCLNGGRCRRGNDRYSATCDCPPGFVGKACETNFDDCKDNQCMNGATCVDGLNSYSCQCPSAYMGVYCTEDVDECARVPTACKNGATCINSRGGYSCICVNGWTGKHCDQNINDCTALVCLNGGTCHDRISSYYCDCPPGKTGFQCQLEDACASNPCKEGSICDTNPTDGSYTCFQCPAGFNGTDCSQDINECELANDLCAHDGVCRNTIGSFVCDCPKGFTGSRCETNINECLSNPCLNDGTCLDLRGAYQCVCMPGFAGDNCETDIDECSSRPCQNGGVCRNVVNGYQCTCVIGFTGLTCADRVSECSLGPCQNGGKCRDSRDRESFQCDCPSGYRGRLCEENISFNPCTSSPCRLNEVCVNDVSRFSCRCRPGYSGKNCDRVENDVSTSYEPTGPFHDDNSRYGGKKECPVADCSSKAKNGRCDEECNKIECGFDGRECEKLNPWVNCTQKTKAPCWAYFRNGRCDEACNIQECLFDGFDCGVPIGRCEPDFDTQYGVNYCINNYGNGRCDKACNNKECYFDGLDCNTEPAQLLEGVLVVIVNIPPDKFPMAQAGFLQKLGRSLKMVAQIEKDKNGRDNFVAWKLTGGIAINPNSTIPTDTVGTAVFIQLDNRTCSSDCFETVDAAAQYLVAAEQQGTLDLGYPLYSVQSQPQSSGQGSGDGDGGGKNNQYYWFLSLLLAVAVLAVAVVMVTHSNKRKRIHATTWFPEGFIKNSVSTAALSEHYGIAQGSGKEFKKTSYDNQGDASGASYYDSDTDLCQPSSGKRFRGASDDPGANFTQVQSGFRKPSDMYAFTPPASLDDSGAFPSLDINAKGPGGMTALMLATMRGNGVDNAEDEHGQIATDPTDAEVGFIIQNLIANGCHLDSLSDVNGETALHLAARYGRPGVVKMLLDAGANVKLRDQTGRTPLHSAVAAGASSILTVFRGYREVDWNAKTDDETTPLILAARLNIDVIDELLKHDVDINLADKSGRTALHWAASVNNYQAVKILLHHGAKVDIQDESAETPLYLAAKEGNFESVRELVVEFRANMEMANDMDKTPRDIALANRHMDIVAFLDQQKDVVHSPQQNMPKNMFSYAPQSVNLPTLSRYTKSGRNKTNYFNSISAAGGDYGTGPKKTTASYRRRTPFESPQIGSLAGLPANYDLKPNVNYLDGRFDMGLYPSPPNKMLTGNYGPIGTMDFYSTGKFGLPQGGGQFAQQMPAPSPVMTRHANDQQYISNLSASPDSPGQWSNSPQSEWSDGTGMPSPKAMMTRIHADHTHPGHPGYHAGQYISSTVGDSGHSQFL